MGRCWFLVCSLALLAIVNGDESHYISSLIDHLNKQDIHTFTEGVLINVQQKDNLYDINANVTVFCNYDLCTPTTVSCKGLFQYVNDDLVVVEKGTNCDLSQLDVKEEAQEAEDALFATVPEIVITPSEPVELAHEIQLNDQYVGSGEQFVAVRRMSSGDDTWCAGCPTDINVNAEGVSDLANQAVQHLDRHKPNENHSLKKIISVQRQAQIVNGIRYILLLDIDTTTCVSNVAEEPCKNITSTSLCQVKILEKPWLKLSDGSKFRAILSNNCTEELTFGDDGEALPASNSDDNIKAVHKEALLGVQNAETQTITAERLKNIEDQIIMDVETTPQSVNTIEDQVTDAIVASVSPQQPDATENVENLVEEVKEQKVVEELGTVQNSMTVDDIIVPITMKSTLSNERKQALDMFLGFMDFDKPLIFEAPAVSNKKETNVAMQKVIDMLQKVSDVSKDSSEEVKPVTKNSIKSSEENSSEEIKDPEVLHVRSRRSVLTFKSEKQQVEELAQHAVDTLDDFDSDDKKRVLLNVMHFSKISSVRSGTIIYKIRMSVGFTNCFEQGSENYDCKKKLINGKNKICNVEVMLKPNGEKNVLSSHCLDNKLIKKIAKRSLRGLPGAPVSVKLPNTEINELAKASLAHYELTTNSSGHTIEEVLSASKQIVSGQLTEITFRVENNSAKKICTASIWERIWLDHREIEIKCKSLSNKVRERRSAKLKEFQHIKILEKLIMDEKKFNDFLLIHRKEYMHKRDEYLKRFKIFRKNLEMIDYLNDNEMGTAKYGVNKFADLSMEEFKASYLGLRPDLHSENNIPFPQAVIPKTKDIPVAFDWRDQGAVTEVKDQGQCGSCWAFSVTGNIEGQYKIKNGNLLSLSEQELVDCDKLDDGCNGGLPDNAYRAIEQLGGLELEKDYPYDAEDEKCNFNKSIARVQISSAVNISSNEDDMAKWLAENGPISIGINANAMQFYMGGISHPLKFLCNHNDLDHGVLIVGYGIHKYPIFKKDMPFWIVKNSWGPNWGERGYYRVYRGDGTCGLNLMASSAVI